MYRHAGRAAGLAMLALVATLISGPLSAGGSDRSGHGDHGKLVGTWLVSVTTYNCTTGAAGPPFTSILSFAAGGTMTENTSNPGFQPGQRSIGLGTWYRTGRQTYWASSVAFIQFDSPAPPPILTFNRGTQRLEQGITMSGPDSWTSEATNVLTRFSDGEEYFSGCARASATRL